MKERKMLLIKNIASCRKLRSAADRAGKNGLETKFALSLIIQRMESVLGVITGCGT